MTYCDHLTIGERTRYYRHWMVNGKVYKSKKSLIKAIEEL